MDKNELTFAFAKEHVIRVSDLLSLMIPKASGVGIMIKGLNGRTNWLTRPCSPMPDLSERHMMI